MPPAGPPAASHGQPTVLHQLRPPRTRLRRSRCAQPPRRCNSAVRGGSCRSAGQWRAPRPVSPGTVTLMADARCARRSADALNELRPLRQRVSRAAGILPTRCRRWLRALFGPPLPAVCSLMPPAGASLLLADNPPSTHLTNPEPLDGARHEVSAVRVRPSPPNPALTQPLLVRFCSR